jgi:hypothetical protein
MTLIPIKAQEHKSFDYFIVAHAHVAAAHGTIGSLPEFRKIIPASGGLMFH